MSDDWKESLPEPLRDAPFIGKADNMDDAIGKLAHAATLVGTSIRIPDENADESQRTAFYEKLTEVPGVARLPTPDDADGLRALFDKVGRPEEADKYLMPELEAFTWDDDIAKDLRTYAHEAGLTNTQFEAMARQMAERDLQLDRAATEAREEARKALKEAWGDTVEDREALIRGWLTQSGAPEALADMLDAQNLPVEAMNWLYNTAEQFKSDTKPLSRDRDTQTPAEVTPDVARAKIQEILNNPAYFDAADPRQKDLMREMERYQRLANPEQAA